MQSNIGRVMSMKANPSNVNKSNLNYKKDSQSVKMAELLNHSELSLVVVRSCVFNL